MSIALQVALFMASLAVVIMVACIIPLAIQAVRWLENLVRTAEQLKVNVQVLLEDSHELVKNINTLTKQANTQMEDVTGMVHTVREWAARADWLVNEIGSVIEPPVFEFVNKTRLFRLGVSTFFQFLLRAHKNDPKENIK